MKNKAVKQMIATQVFNNYFKLKDDCKLVSYFIGDFVSIEVLDPFVFKNYKMNTSIQTTQGVVSLTAEQIKK